MGGETIFLQMEGEEKVFLQMEGGWAGIMEGGERTPENTM